MPRKPAASKKTAPKSAPKKVEKSAPRKAVTPEAAKTKKPAPRKEPTTSKATKSTVSNKPARREDINKLFNKLAKTAANEAAHPVQRRSPEELLYDKNNVDQYKKHQAWPGRKYFLVGNSFNTEHKIVDTTHDTKRKGCIAMLAERGRDNVKCTSIEEALKFPGFRETLSRFEYDWLRKQPPTTLIGPAYNERGELIPQAFAVWRVEESLEKAVQKKKELALR